MEVIHSFFNAMADTTIAKDALIQSGVLDYWIELSIRQADNDGRHTFDERASALCNFLKP
jgi:hypothetical protein